MLSTAAELLKKTAVDSFWSNGWFQVEDAFSGLIDLRTSDQETDTFARLGAPAMPRNWKGDKVAKPLNEYSFTLKNEPWESSFRVPKNLIKFEQWAEIGQGVATLGMKARAHQVKLLSDLINNGTSTTCYDGQFFFDTDHTDPGSTYTTSQDNDLTANIVTVGAPTDAEFIVALEALYDALIGYKDDRGDPVILGTVPKMILMVPPTYASIARKFTVSPNYDTGSGTTGNSMYGLLDIRVNQWMTTTGQIVMFNPNAPRKPFVVNQAGGVELDDDMGGDGNFNSGDVTYSATWWGDAKYAEWRTAASYIFT